MEYSVEFKNLITNLSINPALQFKKAEFVFSRRGGSNNPKSKVTYPEIRGIKVFTKLDKPPEKGRELLDQLDNALYLAEEIFTGLVAKTQCYCYLARPINCVYEGKLYFLDASIWHEVIPEDNVFRGGSVFLDEASFIDEDKNFHPMYHFYRAAKDKSNSNDYRALNAWRFLEALHGKGGWKLRDYLIELGQPEDLVRGFYENIRCAVAHAERLKKKPLTESVILPKSYETQFNGTLIVELAKILRYLDSEVKKLNPKPENIIR